MKNYNWLEISLFRTVRELFLEFQGSALKWRTLCSCSQHLREVCCHPASSAPGHPGRTEPTMYCLYLRKPAFYTAELWNLNGRVNDTNLRNYLEAHSVSSCPLLLCALACFSSFPQSWFLCYQFRLLSAATVSPAVYSHQDSQTGQRLFGGGRCIFHLNLSM